MSRTGAGLWVACGGSVSGAVLALAWISQAADALHRTKDAMTDAPGDARMMALLVLAIILMVVAGSTS